jgi:protein KTI12
VSGLTEAALSRIGKPTASSNTSQLRTPSSQSQSHTAPSKVASRKVRVHHISDHSLSLPRSVYGTARAEKDARASLYSAVKRALGRDDVVVLDSGNYIKGWRYQLHCEAKNLGTPSCVVHVGTIESEARAVNEERLARTGVATEAKEADSSGESKEEQSRGPATYPSATDTTPQNSMTISGPGLIDPYDPQIHAELLMRFEEPNPLARWDSPLFEVPWADATPPLARIWEEMVEPKDRDGARRVIRPNQAAVLTPASAPGHLYVLDKVTQAVLSKVQAYGFEHTGEGGGTVPIDLEELMGVTAAGAVAMDVKSKKVDVHLPMNTLSVPALQRMRRQFIALHRQQMGGMGMTMDGNGERGKLSPARIGELFVDWLNDAFDQG